MNLAICCLLWLGVAADASSPQPSMAWPDAPQSLSAANQERADVVIQGMFSTLEKIQAGEVEIRNEVTPETPCYAEQNWLLFDYGVGSQRFDQRSGRNTQYIRTLREVIIHLPKPGKKPGTVSIVVPEKGANISGSLPIDVRIAGLGDLAKFRNHWTLDRFHDQYDAGESLFPGTLSYLGQTDDQWIELVWVGTASKGRPTKIVLHLDPTREMVPVCQMMFVKGDRGAFELISWSSADWAPVEEVWVPTHWKMRFLTAGVVHDLHLDWKMVNKPVDGAKFALEALNLPERTSIITDRDQGK